GRRAPHRRGGARAGLSTRRPACRPVLFRRIIRRRMAPISGRVNRTEGMHMKPRRIPTATLCFVLTACLMQAAAVEPPPGDGSSHPHPAAQAETPVSLPGRIAPPGSPDAQQPRNTGRIELRTYMLDETAPDLRGQPAGAEVRIYVDERFV